MVFGLPVVAANAGRVILTIYSTVGSTYMELNAGPGMMASYLSPYGNVTPRLSFQNTAATGIFGMVVRLDWPFLMKTACPGRAVPRS